MTSPAHELVQDVDGQNFAPLYAQITVTGAAATLTSLLAALTPPVAIPAWASYAVVTPESAAIRYRCDGTTPTTASGQPIAQWQPWPLPSAIGLAAAQLISQTGGAVTVSVEFRG